ncbi:hypothetical protein BASA81_001790 [Batrachochytrium salamandrivorans]|nr:hypothetical protein BASA81_001790 [Batrachochytrium salamandrivorans]
MGDFARELNNEECTIMLCGLFCSPCVIGEAIEQAGEGNFWVHCTATLFANQLACLPLCLCTVPAMNRISTRLGGEPQWIRHLGCLALCRPCVACQLHRAVKEGRLQGRLGPHAPRTTTGGRTLDSDGEEGGGAPVMRGDMV